jgi:hypothetical protein
MNNETQTSGQGKRIIFEVETGTNRLEKVVFTGSCPIEGGDYVKVLTYDKRVKIKDETYYDARQIHKLIGGKTCRIDCSAKENQ